MSKGISAEKIAIIKERSVAGALPQEIAAELSIAVSTVHHHKGLLKKQGVDFPDMRGSRPKAAVRPKKPDAGHVRSFVVDGTKFIITGKPVVLVGPEGVEITYPSSEKIEK